MARQFALVADVKEGDWLASIPRQRATPKGNNMRAMSVLAFVILFSAAVMLLARLLLES